MNAIESNLAVRPNDELKKLQELGGVSESKEDQKPTGTNLAVSAKSLPPEEVKSKEDIFAEIKANLKKINEFIPVQATSLVFEFDELGDPPVVKVLDKSSQEVIREIPPKEFREMAKALDEVADRLTNSKGVLFNDTV